VDWEGKGEGRTGKEMGTTIFVYERKIGKHLVVSNKLSGI